MISVIGITIITAALVILLSAFNGIEKMIENLYSDFDAELMILPTKGKSFHEDAVDLNKIKSIKGVETVSRQIEEIVVLKHEKKWVNARMLGVDSSFLRISHADQHIVDGIPLLKMEDQDLGIVGATLLDKLGGYIPEKEGYEMIQVYAPKRDAKMRLGSNPFRSRTINISSRINYNREVNAESIVVPLEFAREILNYDKSIGGVCISLDGKRESEEVKEELQRLVGTDFRVRTNFEKNELIFKTSRSERIIVLVILVFIFILAAFNLIASITMLFVEKEDNLNTLESMGATRSDIFRIFFYEGLMISGKGVLFGLILGYLICFTQLFSGILEMPNSGGEPFPIGIRWQDTLLIVFLVGSLSFLFSYLPARILMNRHQNNR
jgi:lipoprotein-releasing system permease protein